MIPPNLNQADARGLLETRKDYGILTFSNGSDWDCWASDNCHACHFFDEDTAGALCAFESAAFLGVASPELALLFGWTQDVEYANYVGPHDPIDSHRHGWNPPQQCAFFRSRDNGEGEDNPPPIPPDPAQLVLLADPTEDAGLITACDVPELETVA